MSWRKARWSDADIVEEEFLGGTRVRLSYPDGTVIIGKLTVAPNARHGMLRVTTAWSGDTWFDVTEADLEVWESDAFDPPD